eukprot:COSAG06_NODE_59348_length_274_cov_0.885714_1_plen_41_part_10
MQVLHEQRAGDGAQVVHEFAALQRTASMHSPGSEGELQHLR